MGWSIRGLAGPIRLLAKYCGEELEEELYEQGDAPAFDRSCWYDVKEKIGLSFPNLPYLIDGDLRLTQSTAILRHIARKHNMLGSTPEECAVVDELLEEAKDMNSRFVGMCYNADFEHLKPAFLQRLPYYLGRLEAFLTSEWFAGSSLTCADFALWHQIEQLVLLEASCLDEFPRLQSFLQRFEGLEQLKKYMTSPSFLHWPINNKSARFGNGPDPKPLN